MKDTREQCTATTRGGDRCRLLAIPGGTVCRFHGGRAPQVQRKANERLIEEQARQLAANYAVSEADLTDPIDALIKLAGEVVGFKDYIAGRVEQIKADDWRYGGLSGEQLRAEVAVYERAMDRASKVLVEINRLGLEERKVRVVERQGELLAGAIRRILERLELSPRQRELVPIVVPEELRAVEA